MAIQFRELPDELRERWTLHSQSLLTSFRMRTGMELIERGGNARNEANACSARLSSSSRMAPSRIRSSTTAMRRRWPCGKSRRKS